MDADIVVYDPAKEFTITNEKMHSDCDHTIWEGVTLHGYPVRTYSRGKLVYIDGRFIGKRAGASSSGAAWPGHSRPPARRLRETRRMIGFPESVK